MLAWVVVLFLRGGLGDLTVLTFGDCWFGVILVVV